MTASPAPRTLLHNGSVYSPADPHATALCLEGQHVVWVGDDLGVDQIVERGIGDRETATRVASLIDRAEYKRRQAAPGVKITPKAFGRDRRLPITNRYPG